MNKQGLLIVSFSLICVVMVTVGFLFWLSEQLAEQKLQHYIQRLERRGIHVKERSMSGFQLDDLISLKFFSDFTFAIDFEGIDLLYFDRKIRSIYFLNLKGDRLVAHIFHYEGKL